MRSGVNPTRRNRNIGTAAQGHGRYGGLWIPGPLNFFERIQNPVWVQRTVGERSIMVAQAASLPQHARPVTQCQGLKLPRCFVAAARR